MSTRAVVMLDCYEAPYSVWTKDTDRTEASRGIGDPQGFGRIGPQYMTEANERPQCCGRGFPQTYQEFTLISTPLECNFRPDASR